MNKQRVNPFPLLLIFLFLVFHFIYLAADSPLFMTNPTEPGLLVDEGLKSLDARNLVLFGSAKWNPDDIYPSWLKKSPVTVFANYVFFKLFGVSLKTARSCSLLFAAGTLTIIYLLLARIYDQRTAIAGLILIMANTVFFFYSRAALLEIKVLFFLVAAVYFVYCVKQSYARVLLTLFAFSLAYWSKQTALLVGFAFIISYLLAMHNGYVIRTIFRPWVIFVGLLLVSSIACIIELNFSYFRNINIYGTGLRNPFSAFLPFPSPGFLKQVPVLTSLAFLYIAFVVTSIVETQQFKKEDLFFIIWFLLGITVHSLFIYRPLRYNLVSAAPLSILAARALVSFPEIIRMLLSKTNIYFKGAIFVFAISFCIVLLSWSFLLETLIERQLLSWMKRHFTYILAVTGSTVVILYLFMAKHFQSEKASFSFLSRVTIIFLLTLFFLKNVVPILQWARYPRYDLQEISHKIEMLDDDKVFAGLWAPQICFDSKKKVLVSHFYQYGINFSNLEKTRPNFLVTADSTDSAFLDKLRETYPCVLEEVPVMEKPYGDQLIRIYQLRF